MTTTALATAPARYLALSRQSFHSLGARFIAWCVGPHVQGIDPAELEALQYAAQALAVS